MPPRIAIDTNGCYTTQAGVSRYIRGLMHGLRAIDSRFAFSEFAWKVENFGFRQPHRTLKTFYRELVWAPLIAPRRLSTESFDVFHSTSGVLVNPPRSIRHVVTIHDLAILRQWHRFRRWHRTSWKHRLRHIKRADRIICISRFTADECIELLDIPAAQIDVVHNGCDFVEPETTPHEEAVDGLPDEFFLFVGSLEPGKNLKLIRETYELAETRGIVLPPLIIVGARWQGLANEGAPPKGWRYLARIPDSQLIHLYRRATALVFPSTYEGFGLPIAEAMSQGCPVICSRVASLEEVGGKAACYPEQNPASYLDAMESLLKNAPKRDAMRAAARDQAEQFTWKKCATSVNLIYESLL